MNATSTRIVLAAASSTGDLINSSFPFILFIFAITLAFVVAFGILLAVLRAGKSI